MRELILGVVVVGLVAGIAVGRIAERTSEARRDYASATTSLEKAKKAMRRNVRNLVLAILVVGTPLLALLLAALRD